MFPFSIVQKISTSGQNNKAFIQVLKGNLGGYYLKFTSRNTYELTLYHEPFLINPVFKVHTELEYHTKEIRIITTNPWGTGASAFMTLTILVPGIISFLKGQEFDFEPLLLIPIIWVVIPGLLFFNYLFRIPVIKEMKNRIDREKQKLH